MMKVPEENLMQIAGIYNREGRTAAYDYVRSHYSIKQPYFLILRLKEHYGYDENTDKFDVEDTNIVSENLFMSMDELCSAAKSNALVLNRNSQSEAKPSRAEELEKLVKELISDRLLEISRYITVDSLSKTILIDRTSLGADGYRVVEH